MNQSDFYLKDYEFKSTVTIYSSFPLRSCWPEGSHQDFSPNYELAAVFTSTTSFIWKSGNKLAGIQLRTRKGQTESMREGNDMCKARHLIPSL